MKNNFILVFTLLILTMCNPPKKEEKLEDDPNFRSAEQVIPEQQKIEEITQSNETQEKRNELSYMSINNPDTALAYFLYETHNVFKPFEYQEEYQRLDLEYDKQVSLIKSIFSDKEDLEETLKAIGQIRKKFIDSIRNSVYQDYKKYHGVSGMSFDFLLARKDSLVKPLLYELAEDEKAPQSEREYAAKVLIDNYQDSTFMNILE